MIVTRHRIQKMHNYQKFKDYHIDVIIALEDYEKMGTCFYSH